MRMITSQMSWTFPGPSAGWGKLGLKKCFREKTVFFSSYRVHCSSEVHNHCPSLGSTQRLSVIGAGSREGSTLLRWGVGGALTGRTTDQSPTNARRGTTTPDMFIGPWESPISISAYPEIPGPWWTLTGISYPASPRVRLRKREWPPHLMGLSPHSLLEPVLY